MKYLKKFESSNYSFIPGRTYKITFPVYDDFDEGLEADIESIKVVKKTNNGYLVENIDTKETYEILQSILYDCEVEEI